MSSYAGVETSTIEEIAQEILAERRIPCATYRLQFHQGFTFEHARQLIPYLSALGISDCYASPLQKPRAGSTHGYDICDHGELNPALGGEQQFERFSASLQQHGMGLLLDTVPNHMGIGDPANGWWMDVLENGASSLYSAYFDIDWLPVKPELHNKVLLPILGDQYGRVLESGQIRLGYDDGAFFLSVYQTRLPIAPGTYGEILGLSLPQLVEQLGEQDEQLQEYQSIITAISYLPSRTEQDQARLIERNREKEIIKRRIAALYAQSQPMRQAIEQAVTLLNGTPGQTASFDLLDGLIERQAYRLAFWRVSSEEINYRRFFDINDLAAIRVEHRQVFEQTHELIFRLLGEGTLTGLRIDHPDGLWNPPTYFYRLQVTYLRNKILRRLAATGEADQHEVEQLEQQVADWVRRRYGRRSRSGGIARHSTSPRSIWPLYVIAEKILSEQEPLPADWAVYGTTGYDFLGQVNGIFIDRRRRQSFDRSYSQFIGGQVDYGNLVNSAKKMIMLIALSSEINALSHLIERIGERNRHYRDFTLNGLTFAIREIIASLPIYRTYINAPSRIVSPRDQRFIDRAVEEAKERNPRTDESVFDFIRDTLLLRNLGSFSEADQPALHEFVMKFQQLSGPVMAKGVEDTVFYNYNRLVSLNEVGGHPPQFGISVGQFHKHNDERQRHWPHSMLSTSTHDTKRSEDVRARLNVLSELPDEWAAALQRWQRMNVRHKLLADERPAPDRNDEYLLYQSVLGIWPYPDVAGPDEIDQLRQRLQAYMEKATREAKRHTSWINPNEQYELAVRHFVDCLLDTSAPNPFLEDLRPLQRALGFYGQFNALSQLLLKLTSPGVPDIYQGSELWDLSLVDPDNRRPVDYQRRRELLAELERRVADQHDVAQLQLLARELVEHSPDGRIKLYLTYRVLNYRRRHEQLFSEGSYQPLEALGEHREHICAFARLAPQAAALVVVPRLVARLTRGEQRPPLGQPVWHESWLGLPFERPGSCYRDLLTGALLRVGQRDGALGLPLAEVLAHFPVALLEKLETDSPQRHRDTELLNYIEPGD